MDDFPMKPSINYDNSPRFWESGHLWYPFSETRQNSGLEVSEAAPFEATAMSGVKLVICEDGVKWIKFIPSSIV